MSSTFQMTIVRMLMFTMVFSSFVYFLISEHHNRIQAAKSIRQLNDSNLNINLGKLLKASGMDHLRSALRQLGYPLSIRVSSTAYPTNKRRRKAQLFQQYDEDEESTTPMSIIGAPAAVSSVVENWWLSKNSSESLDESEAAEAMFLLNQWHDHNFIDYDDNFVGQVKSNVDPIYLLNSWHARLHPENETENIGIINSTESSEVADITSILSQWQDELLHDLEIHETAEAMYLLREWKKHNESVNITDTDTVQVDPRDLLSHWHAEKHELDNLMDQQETESSEEQTNDFPLLEEKKEHVMDFLSSWQDKDSVPNTDINDYSKYSLIDKLTADNPIRNFISSVMSDTEQPEQSSESDEQEFVDDFLNAFFLTRDRSQHSETADWLGYIQQSLKEENDVKAANALKTENASLPQMDMDNLIDSVITEESNFGVVSEVFENLEQEDIGYQSANDTLSVINGTSLIGVFESLKDTSNQTQMEMGDIFDTFNDEEQQNLVVSDQSQEFGQVFGDNPVSQDMDEQLDATALNESEIQAEIPESMNLSAAFFDVYKNLIQSNENEMESNDSLATGEPIDGILEQENPIQSLDDVVQSVVTGLVFDNDDSSLVQTDDTPSLDANVNFDNELSEILQHQSSNESENSVQQFLDETQNLISNILSAQQDVDNTNTDGQAPTHVAENVVQDIDNNALNMFPASEPKQPDAIIASVDIQSPIPPVQAPLDNFNQVQALGSLPVSNSQLQPISQEFQQPISQEFQHRQLQQVQSQVADQVLPTANQPLNNANQVLSSVQDLRQANITALQFQQLQQLQLQQPVTNITQVSGHTQMIPQNHIEGNPSLQANQASINQQNTIGSPLLSAVQPSGLHLPFNAQSYVQNQILPTNQTQAIPNEAQMNTGQILNHTHNPLIANQQQQTYDHNQIAPTNYTHAFINQAQMHAGQTSNLTQLLFPLLQQHQQNQSHSIINHTPLADNLQTLPNSTGILVQPIPDVAQNIAQSDSTNMLQQAPELPEIQPPASQDSINGPLQPADNAPAEMTTPDLKLYLPPKPTKPPTIYTIEDIAAQLAPHKGSESGTSYDQTFSDHASIDFKDKMMEQSKWTNHESQQSESSIASNTYQGKVYEDHEKAPLPFDHLPIDHQLGFMDEQQVETHIFATLDDAEELAKKHDEQAIPYQEELANIQMQKEEIMNQFKSGRAEYVETIYDENTDEQAAVEETPQYASEMHRQAFDIEIKSSEFEAEPVDYNAEDEMDIEPPSEFNQEPVQSQSIFKRPPPPHPKMDSVTTAIKHPPPHVVRQEMPEAVSAPRLPPKTVSKNTNVIFYSYLRGGSSIGGEMFNQDPNTFYWYEPLDAFYSAHYGIPQQTIPAHQLYDTEGTRREPTPEERRWLITYFRNMFECKLGELPPDLFAHVFRHKTDNLHGFTTCYQKVKDRISVDTCRSYTIPFCGESVQDAINKKCHVVLTATNRMRKSLPQRSIGDFSIRESEMRKYITELKANIGPKIKLSPDMTKNLDAFITHQICVNVIANQISKCLPKATKVCQESPIHVAKVLRLRFDELDELTYLYPKMKVIYYTRDPRAMAYSRAQIDMVKSRRDPSYIEEARFICTRLKNDLKKKIILDKHNPGKVLNINYETLAKDPMAYAETVYKFIGRKPPAEWKKFLNAMAKEKEDDGPFGLVRLHPQKTSTAWRRLITNPQALVNLQAKCKSELLQLGYE